MQPLEHPQEMMVIALGFGIVVLTVGLLLDALGAFWRRLFGYWMATRAGILVAYMGIVFAFLHPDFLLLTWIGFTWFVLGSALTSQHNKWLEIPKALGELVEGMLQLLVNTVSFVRVGAFALAHAGLSAAIMGMADATGGGIFWLVVMILGNALVIALEGLIVGIQTTRLLLFEFFIRFLTAEGRQLKPLSGPGSAIRPTGRSSS
jgi:V/A-type H+-transporting ATPase subunit I